MIHSRNKSQIILSFAILVLSTILSIRSFAMNEEVPSKIVVKLTYTGPQNKTVPSLIFKEANYEDPIQKFRALNLYYPNDEEMSQIFSVSHKAMKKIEAAILRKMIEIGIAKENPILTIVMLYIDTDEYKQMILSKPEAIEIMSCIHDAISFEKDTNEAIDIWLSRTDLKRN